MWLTKAPYAHTRGPQAKTHRRSHSPLTPHAKHGLDEIGNNLTQGKAKKKKATRSRDPDLATWTHLPMGRTTQATLTANSSLLTLASSSLGSRPQFPKFFVPAGAPSAWYFAGYPRVCRLLPATLDVVEPTKDRDRVEPRSEWASVLVARKPCGNWPRSTQTPRDPVLGRGGEWEGRDATLSPDLSPTDNFFFSHRAQGSPLPVTSSVAAPPCAPSNNPPGLPSPNPRHPPSGMWHCGREGGIRLSAPGEEKRLRSAYWAQSWGEANWPLLRRVEWGSRRPGAGACLQRSTKPCARAGDKGADWALGSALEGRWGTHRIPAGPVPGPLGNARTNCSSDLTLGRCIVYVAPSLLLESARSYSTPLGASSSRALLKTHQALQII